VHTIDGALQGGCREKDRASELMAYPTISSAYPCGFTENAGHEIAGHENTGHEFARHDKIV